jgi:hypothetical protein
MKKLLVSPQGEELVDLTAEEISLKEQEAEQFEISKQNKINAEQDAIDKKASGKQKLLDLGLSEEEVKAMIGI